MTLYCISMLNLSSFLFVCFMLLSHACFETPLSLISVARGILQIEDMDSLIMRCILISKKLNCDIVSIFDNVKCGQIEISRQRLSSEETQGLVRHMDNVERVELGFVGDVSLDIIQCSGQ